MVLLKKSPMRIAYLTGMLPARMNNGTEIATRMIVDTIKELGHTVVMVGYSRPDDVLPGVKTIVVDRRPIEFVDAPRWQKMAWAAEAVLRHEPLSVSKYRHPSNLRELKQEIKQGFDCFIVDKPQIAMVFRRLLADHPFSVIWHAIEHQTYAAVAEDMSGFSQRVYRREARLAERMEQRVVNRAQHVFTLTQADAKAVTRLGRVGPINVIPMTVPIVTNTKPRDNKFDYDIGLLGNWTWAANASGLAWFLRSVRPLLPSNFKIAIGGRGAETVAPEVSDVIRVGYVEDARLFLDKCRAVAIPLLAGTGVSMKVVEAACAGYPTVTTTVGVRGLDQLPENVLVADQPYAFAMTCVEQSKKDSWQRILWKQTGDTWMQNRRLELSTAINSGLSYLWRPSA